MVLPEATRAAEPEVPGVSAALPKAFRVSLPKTAAAIVPKVAATLPQPAALEADVYMTEAPLPAPLPEVGQPDAAVPIREEAEAGAGEDVGAPGTEAPKDTSGSATAPAFVTNLHAEGWHRSPRCPWRAAASNPNEAMSNPGPSPWASDEEQGPTRQGFSDVTRPQSPRFCPFTTDLVRGCTQPLAAAVQQGQQPFCTVVADL